MKRIVGLLAVILIALSLAGHSSALAANPNPHTKGNPDAPVKGKVIPNKYIVVLKDGASAKAVAAIAGVKPSFVYDAALNGFAAELNKGQLTALQHNPNVAYIEEDQEVALVATQSVAVGGGLWGLDRIDQRALPLSGGFTYNTTASNVTAYIIDTGLQANHSQFGTRAQNVYDALGGNGADCNGHGTHVAGTIGGSTYGVAKGVKLRGVRVLGCNGSGSTSGIIAAVNWVKANAVKPAVANMSLGGGYSSSLNTAVSSLASSGVFVAVAAGNENQAACNVSPASASGTLTVAASDKTDTRASFSNYGGCVDVYAPGVGIQSAWINSGTNTINGTSMAAPHAAGVAALYKGAYGDAASSTIVTWIINNSTTNVIKSNITGTPNRLLYKAGM